MRSACAAIKQVVGGLLLILPRTALIGLVLLGATMLGAVGSHLFLLDTGIGGAIIPGTILIFPIVTARRRFTDRSNQEPVIIGSDRRQYRLRPLAWRNCYLSAGIDGVRLRSGSWPIARKED